MQVKFPIPPSNPDALAVAKAALAAAEDKLSEARAKVAPLRDEYDRLSREVERAERAEKHHAAAVALAAEAKEKGWILLASDYGRIGALTGTQPKRRTGIAIYNGERESVVFTLTDRGWVNRPSFSIWKECDE